MTLLTGRFEAWLLENLKLAVVAHIKGEAVAEVVGKHLLGVVLVPVKLLLVGLAVAVLVLLDKEKAL